MIVTTDLTDSLPDLTAVELRYPPDKLDMIHRFLAACVTKAEVALQAETPEDKTLLMHPLVKARMAYWRHVASGLRWAGYLATRKQLHLTESDPPYLKGLVEQWMTLPPE